MVSKWVQVCDLEHDDEDDVPAVESKAFEANGKKFTLDLCSSHLIQFQAFEDQQLKWQNAAREDSTPVGSPGPRPRGAGDTPERRKENQAVRDWAKTQPDIDLGERGRIPEGVRQRYRDAMGEQARGRWDQARESNGTPIAAGAVSS